MALVVASSEDVMGQNIRGLSLVCEVKDHLTHDAVKVRDAVLLWARDSTMADTIKVRYSMVGNCANSYISINIKKPGRYLVRVEADSFRTAYFPLDIKKIYKHENRRTLPNLYMRRLPRKQDMELGEVVVKATKLQFYMDGDTLVYDADAFNLSEGSMMDALLKKMPGVTLESGGVIKVNGRKVDALLLNGKDFFDSNRELLLENMPAYMVRKIQSYERVPERVRDTPFAYNARKEYVMDVKLKRDYSAGWLYNVDAGGGRTLFRDDDGHYAGKYAGRLFGMRFSDESALVCFANGNNVNDESTPGQGGEWNPFAQSDGVQTTYMAGATYVTEKQDAYRYNASVDGSYKECDEADNANAATFLSGGDVYSRSFHARKSYECAVSSNHSIMVQHMDAWHDLVKYVYMNVNPYFSYRHWNNRISSGSVALSEDVSSRLGKAWIDSIKAPGGGELLKRYAISRNLSLSKGNGHSVSEQVNASVSFSPAHNDHFLFTLGVNQSWSDDRSESFEHYRLDYPSADASQMDFRNKYSPAYNRTSSFSIEQKTDFHLDRKNVNVLYMKYVFGHSYVYSNSPIYLLHKLEGWSSDADGGSGKPIGMLPSAEDMLKAIDTGNSSASKKMTDAFTSQLGYRYSKSSDEAYASVDVGLSVPVERESLRYSRGVQIDTLARRTMSFLNPSVSVYYSRFSSGLSVSFDYSMGHTAPSMVSMLDMRDDDDPLNVMLGNAELRSAVSHSFSASYNDRYGKCSVNAYANVNVVDNAVASAFVYDKSTGVRTVRPQNVDGNWSFGTGMGLSAPLMGDYKMSIDQQLSFMRVHSVDVSGTEQLQASRSVVVTDNIEESLSLSWQPTDMLECGASGKVDFQHVASRRPDFSGIDAFSYQYGLRACVNLPWGMSVSSDVTMYSRRGYSESVMNTDELVWNARVEKRLAKANLTLAFEGFDLLGNLSSVQRSVDAQGRTEAFYNVVPSYGLLHVLWRPGSKKKAKQTH